MSCTGKCNPRYVLYAKAHGKTAEEMVEYDDECWPGGAMCGFILWMDQVWREFRKLNGIRHYDPVGPEDQKKFDEWLERKVRR